MSIWKYIRRKAIEYVAIWYVALSMDFVLPHLLPIDPAQMLVNKFINAATNYLTPDQLQILAQSIENQFGFNQPIYIQYIKFIWNALHLNLGISIWLFGTPVTQIILNALPYDVILLVPAILISWYLGNMLGAYLGFDKRGSILDKISMPLFYTLSHAPYFWFAIILLWLFAGILKILPGTGMPLSTVPSFTWRYIGQLLLHMTLPLMSLILVSIGNWAIGMRQSMLNEIRSSYAIYSESLGLTRSIIRKYTYKNAILPQITGLAISLGSIVAGNSVLEFTFGYPGIGMILGNAIGNYDLFLIIGIFFFVVTMIIIANFIIDIVYIIINPRIRAGEIK